VDLESNSLRFLSRLSSCITAGAARAVAALQPEGVEAHFVVAACDNMINEKGLVPSDILIASNGKTIEVLNTGKSAGARSNKYGCSLAKHERN
jgi:hypothetical protein